MNTIRVITAKTEKISLYRNYTTDVAAEQEDLLKTVKSVDGGTLSGGVTWKFYENGCLLVEGDGVMPDYTDKNYTNKYNFNKFFAIIPKFSIFASTIV